MDIYLLTVQSVEPVCADVANYMYGNVRAVGSNPD